MAIGQTPLQAIEELIALLNPSQLQELARVLSKPIDLCAKLGHKYKKVTHKKYGWFSHPKQFSPCEEVVLFCERCGRFERKRL